MRSDRWIAAGIFALVFAVYWCTLPPSYGMWDTAELQTVVGILGIAHPPGSPFFVLLGFAFAHIVPFGEVAWRVGVMCAACVACSMVLAYLVARSFGASRSASAICVLGCAFSLVVWRDATRAETLDVALFARTLALFFGLRWYAAARVRDLFAMALAMSLAFATHALSIFLLPSLALLTLGRREARARRSLVALAGGFSIGLLPFAYLPLRSIWIDAHHLEPLTALGLPAGQAFWNYDDPSTWSRFVRVVTGADFHVKGGFDGYFAIGRYGDFVARASRRIAEAFGYAGTMLTLGGAIVFVAGRKLDRLAIVLAAIVPVPYTESYADLQDPERYYLLMYWCAAIVMAVAFDRIALLFQLRPATIGRAAAGLALLVSFACTAPERLAILGQRDDRTGPAYTAKVLAATPDDAIILADWAYATPLAYAAYVQHRIGHRTVIPASPSQYLREAAMWAKTRPVFFVGFDDDLRLTGWDARLVASSNWYAYRLVKTK